MSGSPVFLKPLDSDQIGLYLDLGIRSYKEHYLHLWKNENPNDYIQASFTRELVAQELGDAELYHYIPHAGSTPIGIVKLNASMEFPLEEKPDSLLLEKIYLLRNASGKAYGTRILQLIEQLAKEMGKKWLWLETMQQGPALDFYLKRGFENVGETRLQFPGAKEEERGMFILLKSTAIL